MPAGGMDFLLPLLNEGYLAAAVEMPPNRCWQKSILVKNVHIPNEKDFPGG